MTWAQFANNHWLIASVWLLWICGCFWKSASGWSVVIRRQEP